MVANRGPEGERDQSALINGSAAMNLLTAFGLTAVSLMLLFYSLEQRGRIYTLGFAFACTLGSVYGFLQGAWPFGIVSSRFNIN